MNNETTASQPKSIGDDAQFLQVLRDWHNSNQPFSDMEFNKLVDYLNSRAPAAQASATIQAAPTFECGACHGSGWVPRDPDIGTDQECFCCGGSGEDEEAALIAQAATIQEPVMVADPVGRIMSQSNEAVAVFGIQVEKELCKLLGREWLVCGISIESLCADIAKRLAAPMVADPAGVDRDGRMSDELRKMIEGMSVSVDVSTGDDDAGNRYFGTVNEVMDGYHGEKHGVMLLIQDPEPNFDLAATVKTVPSEALTLNEFVAMADECCVWATSDSMEKFMQRLFAAPLADKTGGDE